MLVLGNKICKKPLSNGWSQWDLAEQKSNAWLTSTYICETEMINDPAAHSRSQKALEVARFSKPSPCDTAKKSRTVDQLAELGKLPWWPSRLHRLALFPSPHHHSLIHIYTRK